MARTELEEWDVFGIFDGPPSPPTTHLTIRQYVGLVQWIGQCLGISDIFFRFNLPFVGNDDDDDDDGGGGVALNACGHPPVCVHLAREDGLHAMRHPNSLPTVVRDDVNMAVHGPPYVHCLFCLHETKKVYGPAVIPDLRQNILGHCMCHLRKRNECLALLEGEAVAHMGEIGWGIDLSLEAQREELEKKAEWEGRHGCFIVSANTAACPIIVTYCALCDQLAPLATFVTASKETEHDGNKNNNKQGQGVEEEEEKEEEARSMEETELILARILLACELLYLLRCERTQVGRVSLPHVQQERYIFLSTPCLFGENSEELTDTFESGVMATYSSVILPMATVNGTPDMPCLCLMDREATVQFLRSQLPPYQFTDAVVGFVMEWPTEAETDEKVEWVLRQQNGDLNVQRRLVFMEDRDEWIIAYVFYHHETTSLENRSETEVDHMYVDRGLRFRKDCSVVKMVPVSLLQQYTLQDRYGREDMTSCMKNVNNKMENKVDATLLVEEEKEKAPMGCPYSMEARAVHFFTGMMALAKAMKMVTDHLKEHQP
ncbi:hypothetical protein MOQ_005041 [Trypanosoma cruzi marinkellei]|uniref:Uncharacterized protein n=1 Tax=Trypanosoma cruzi marinkellei TaxID=85056 RepID=K2M7Z7_TRYCR|nr:hypothetical protein MOQ_005041 [Trypanosoma cruzi marinkellei]